MAQEAHVTQPSDVRNSLLYFKWVPEGFVFRAPNPWIFGAADHYLVSEAQRDEIAAILLPQRPRRAVAKLVAIQRCKLADSIRRHFRHDLSLSRIISPQQAVSGWSSRPCGGDDPAVVRVDSHCRPPQPAPIGTDPCRRAAYRSADHQRRNSRSCQRQDVAQAILAHRRCLRLREPPCARGPRLRRAI